MMETTNTRRCQMANEGGITYAKAGVDIDAAVATLKQVGSLIQSTQDDSVLSDDRSFCGLVQLTPELVLGIGNDGVGTKLQVAIMAGKFKGVGMDLVCHMGNDLVCHGVRPSYMVDYFATVNLKEMTNAFIGTLAGMCSLCKSQGISVIAGETAEMPGTYVPGQYDFVGTLIGTAPSNLLVTGSTIQPGDQVVGLRSNGIHTNGLSLVRRVIFEELGMGIDDELPWGPTVADELLRGHCSYVREVMPLVEAGMVHGMAHITGGGLPGNLIRQLPEGCRAVLEFGSWPVPDIFTFVREHANQPWDDWTTTFNIGVGFCLVMSEGDTGEALAQLGDDAMIIGKIVAGERGVELNEPK